MTPALVATEALGTAIRAELDAWEVYIGLADPIADPFLQKNLLALAGEELHHKQLLQDACEKEFPALPLTLPPSYLPKQLSCRAERDQLSVKEILSCVIEKERQSRELHLQVVETTDLTVQQMFAFLADSEFSDHTELSDELEQLAQYPRLFEEPKKNPESEIQKPTSTGHCLDW